MAAITVKIGRTTPFEIKISERDALDFQEARIDALSLLTARLEPLTLRALKNSGMKIQIAIVKDANGDYFLRVTPTDHEIILGSVNGDTLYVKKNGTWKKVTKIYQKQGGHWTETSVDGLFSDCSNNTNSGYFFNK